MKILHRNKNVVNIGLFSKADYSVLDYEQLLSVNGAGGSSGSGGGGPSGPTGSSSTTSGYGSCGGGTNSSGSNLSDREYPSSTEGYDPSAPATQQNAKILAVDTGSDGYPDHFVNDIGNGQYYDPWTGSKGNISDLNLATEGLGEKRELEYKK